VVAALAVDPATGDLRELNRVSTLGEHPCYVSLDPAGEHLFAANYSSGSISVFPILADGSIGPVSDHVKHEGSSVRPERQGEPHAHSVISDPTGRYQLVCDLGTDKIMIYQTGVSGRLTAAGQIVSAPGAGPRHLEFHPELPVLYVMNELSCTVNVYSFTPDSLAAISLLEAESTLPADYNGVNTGADIHIHPSGRYLYASNRGHDSIAVYEILKDGFLIHLAFVSSGGKTPRNFAVSPDGRYLLAANQESGTVVVFEIGMDGIPVPNGRTYVIESPVCLRF
jgi:6-phosphogluconolactonase